jgi:hypothetical protein
MVEVFVKPPPLFGCLRLRQYFYVSATIRLFEEMDFAIRQSEERVVDTHADILTGVPLCAALTHDDVAADDSFTTELLHAKTTTV